MAASETPPKPKGPRGPQKKVEDIDPPSDALKYLPYLAVVAVVIGLVATIMRSPANAVNAATALLAGGALALGYIAWQDTHSLPPEDGFRKLVAAATVAVVLVLLGTVAITLHPAPAAGTVTLQHAGDMGAVNVTGAAADLFLEVSGTFEADVGPSARAAYVLHVTRGSTEEEVDGAFERSAGQSPLAGGNMAAAAGTEATANRQWLTTLHGPGHYAVTLDRMPDNLRPPIRAALRSEPFAPWMLALLFALMAAVVLAVDVGLSRRGIEPAYGPALLLGLTLVFYFHGHYAGANVGEGLFASFLVGLLAGGLGGEVVARIVRKVAG